MQEPLFKTQGWYSFFNKFFFHSSILNRALLKSYFSEIFTNFLRQVFRINRIMAVFRLKSLYFDTKDAFYQKGAHQPSFFSLKLKTIPDFNHSEIYRHLLGPVFLVIKTIKCHFCFSPNFNRKILSMLLLSHEGMSQCMQY